jgi:hypothetical protein
VADFLFVADVAAQQDSDAPAAVGQHPPAAQQSMRGAPSELGVQHPS